MLRKLGRFVEFSVFNDEATVDGSIIGDMHGVVTHKFALADVKEAFAVMERGDKSLKVVLEP